MVGGVAAQTDTNLTALPADTNAPAAPSDTNTLAKPADTNAPVAQTDTNGVAAYTDTNTIVAQAETNATAAQTYTNTVRIPTNTMATAATHPMSLEDCIQEALQHNLDMQISRFNPQIQLFNVRASYGGWDPTLDVSGSHVRNDTGPELQNNVLLPASTSDQNIYNSDLSGTLPWGTIYDLNANLTDTRNANFSLANTNLNLFTNSIAQSDNGSVGITLTQPLLKNFWTDNTRLTIKIAKNLLKSDIQGLRLQVITSVTDVENAYYELIFARENVKVQQEALILAQTQLDQDRQRVQIGTLSPLDVQQDEAQVATSEANLIAAQYTFAQDQNTLKNLLSDTNYRTWHDTDIQPTDVITNAPLQLFDLQDSWTKGLGDRPDLLQARLQVEAQGIQLKFNYNQLYPELNVKGSYGFNGQGSTYNDVVSQVQNQDRPFYSIGGELIVPLSNASARNNYKAAKVTLQQLLLKMKQFEQNVMVEIDNAVKNAQSTYQSVAATRQARIYAEAALDAEQKKYAVGKSTTFTVLQLQNNLTSARSQEIRALANYYEALTNLAQQEGSTLERNHINIDLR